MALPLLPTVGFETPNHRRRTIETVNNILTFEFDDWRRRTDEERIAGVTPVNPAYPPGDLRRYGAIGDGATNDAQAVEDATSLDGAAYAPNGTYKLNSKVTVTGQLSLSGENMENTKIVSGGTGSYLLEIGDGSGNYANCGTIHTLSFTGASGDDGILHFQQPTVGNPPSYWHLRDLLFRPSPCSAMVLARIWDSWFNNIDALQCGTGSDPSIGASLIITNDSNNLYFNGLHFEAALSGAIYLANGGPIYIATGKIDNGFAASQQCAAITLDDTGGLLRIPTLYLDDYSIQGMDTQYAIDCEGSIHLGKVLFDGGSNMAAHIYDHRKWYQVNPSTYTGVTGAHIGPFIPAMDLGHAHFNRTHPSVEDVTGAVVYSKIYPIRFLNNLTVSANGSTTATTRVLGTNATTAVNGIYDGCYLVHNATGTQAGTQAGARRKIKSSLSNGNLEVYGTQAATLDGDWSIEFCPHHATPIRHRDVQMESGMDLFAVISPDVTILNSPAYDSTPANATYGLTVFTVSGTGITTSQDVTGFYLIDNVTGEPFYLGYGVDGSSFVGVMYNRVASLNTTHTFSIVAGYSADVQVQGASAVWEFAGRRMSAFLSDLSLQGYEPHEVPLWGFGPNKSWTATLTGCTTSPTGAVGYTLGPDNVVFLTIPAISATSNTMAATLTGLPAHLIPAASRLVTAINIDNGVNVLSALSIGSDGVITLYNGASVTFTDSGTKGIAGGDFCYRL